MAAPNLFPRFMTPNAFGATLSSVILPANGVQLTTPDISAIINPERRIVALPSQIDVTVSDTGQNVSIGGGLNVTLNSNTINAEVC
jgi:hypothetical protein